ncbi:MAG TPA: DUF3810 domain-containing protein [Blastocatellia bacterium]|nr:DUF3810 domain-containing protein [Blastocatellia bacterium]
MGFLRVPLRPSVTPKVSAVEDDFGPEEGDSVEDVQARYIFWRALFWLIMAFAVQTLASLAPETVESVYSQTAYYYLVRWLSAANKFISKPLGELLFVGIILWYIGFTLWYLGRAFRRETNLVDVLKVLVLQVAWLFTFAFAAFLLMWGLNYQRQPIEERMDLERRAEGRQELIDVGRRIIDGINRNYSTRDAVAATGTSLMTVSQPKLFQSIENSFQLENSLGAASQGGFSDPKPLIFSKVATWLDIRAVYIPYTGEATYNENLLDCDLPFVIAHAKAHQRGFAREDEANFIAFLACIKSNEPYVRYSGFLHALKVLDFLARSDVQDTQALRAQLAPGPAADVTARETFGVRSKSSSLAPISDSIINIYLRANRIRGGLKNFSEDTPLIVNYMLRNPER